MGLNFPFPELARQKKKGSNAVGQFRFPDDLGQHYMHITFEEYQYNAKDRQATSAVKPVRNVKDSIALPLCEQLLDNSALNVRGNELGTLGGEIGTQSYDAVKRVAQAVNNQGLSGLKEAIPDMGTVKNIAGTGGAYLLKQGIGEIAPQLQKGLEVGAGFAFNPYQALTFEGVELKTHVFDWVLAPSTRAESQAVKDIIRTIKKHIHPEYATISDITGIGGLGGRSFLKYPDIINVKILGSDPWDIPVYKRGMISQFQVNYNGAGEHAFLEGGKPAVLRLSMTMMEMEIWTREDYDSSTNPVQEVRQDDDIGL